MSAVKERPIPYSGPMVRARIAGTKTQTRRAWREQPPAGVRVGYVPGETRTPYGQAGDRLWVREAWRTLKAYDGLPPREVPRDAPIWYEADGPAPAEFGRYRHAKFMCRWMSRGMDEVVSVRVERLQDISDADAIAEGIEPGAADGYWRLYGRNTNSDMDRSPRVSYRSLWEQINGAGSWDANPLVWVVEFKRLETSA